MELLNPVYQTKLEEAGERGNCLAAAVASLFGLSLNDVPEFEEIRSPGQWKEAFRDWACTRGYAIQKGYSLKPDTLCLAVGHSQRGKRHAVVARGQHLVHDPHPSQSGLVTFEYCLYFIPLAANGTSQ